MTFFDALILGVVEGVTEFLPISSTGHLILASQLLGLTGDFVKSFEIAIQLGAIAAVLVLYGGSQRTSLSVLKRLLVAFIPTGVIGFVTYPLVKNYLLGSSTVVIVTLALGGLALVMFEHWHTVRERNSLTEVSYQHAFIIGCCQAFAIIPGVSRAAATIVGGLMLGISRATIVEFSFLLAVPTMLAATGYDLIKNSNLFTSSEYILLAIGFMSAFVTALLSIRWLLSFIQTHNFAPFGYYRIALALAWVALFF